MQNPVFYGAFLEISWIKPRSVVTNYSECMRSNSAYRALTSHGLKHRALSACAATSWIRSFSSRVHALCIASWCALSQLEFLTMFGSFKRFVLSFSVACLYSSYLEA